MSKQQVTASDLRAARTKRLAEDSEKGKSADSSSVSSPAAAKPVETVIPPSMQGKGEKGSDSAKAPEADKSKDNGSGPTEKAESKSSEGDKKEPAEDCGPSMGKKAASVPEVITAAVVDPTTVPLSANVEGFLFGEGTNAPHWMIVANGEPVAKLPHTSFPHWNDKNGQPNKQAQAYFQSTEFFKTVKHNCSKQPLPEVLAGLKAQPYVATVQGAQAHKDLTASVTKTASAQFAVEKGRIVDSFKNMLSLVIQAQEKNYLPTQPLKHAMFQEMTKAGVQNPVPHIDAAFREAATAQFEAMFDQAETWMGYSPQAQEDVRRQIEGMQYRAPQARTAGTIPTNSQRDGAAPSARNNVPVIPRSEPLQRNAETVSDVQSVKDSLGLGARARLDRAGR